MTRKKYYISIDKFSNSLTLFFVQDGADVNALEELMKRNTSFERITRKRALSLARQMYRQIYKCTSLFVYDHEKNFGKDYIFMDARGNMHGYHCYR